MLLTGNYTSSQTFYKNNIEKLTPKISNLLTASLESLVAEVQFLTPLATKWSQFWTLILKNQVSYGIFYDKYTTQKSKTLLCI